MSPDDDNQCPRISDTQMTIDNANGDSCPHTISAFINEHFRVNIKLKDVLFARSLDTIESVWINMSVTS